MRILVECKADLIFLSKVLADREGIKLKHGRNKSEIVKYLTKSNFSGTLGMIDEDPKVNPPSFLLQYYIKHLERNDLFVYRNLENKTSLIVLRPRLEEFVLSIAKIARISLKDYGLPNDGEKLHTIINLQLKSFNKLVEKLSIINEPSFKELKTVFDDEIKWVTESK